MTCIELFCIQMDDRILVYIEDQEASQGSVDSPFAYDILSKQVTKSTP